MVRNPSTSEGHSGGSSPAGGQERQRENTNSRERNKGGAIENDPTVEGSGDPWAEAEAKHPDEGSSDSLEQHPQADDRTTRNPGG